MTDAHGVARDQLRAFVERIERLEEEKKSIADDIKDVYGEAKAMGFDTKILKMVISLRKKDEQQRTEEEIILDTYLQALGMIPAFEREEDKPATATRRVDGFCSVQDALKMSTNGADAGVAEKNDDTVKADEMSLTVVGTESGTVSNSESDAVATVATAITSDERVTPYRSGSAAANVGGDHVTETPHFAAIRPGLVSNSPANHPLRPNCKNPGSQCAGYGPKLCHACAVAVRELETT